MSSRTRSNRRRSGRTSIHKPNGLLHPRVQKVGPEHFGIVCVDVGKAKSEWILSNFYGKVLVEPTELIHTKQFRQPSNPGNKTDENDLHAMVRATVSGFGLSECELDEGFQQLRLLTRHRRDLGR